MRLELIEHGENANPDPAVPAGLRAIRRTVGIALSAHNAVCLADRVLRDGRTDADGVFRRSGENFFGVTGESDEIHYGGAGRRLPSVEERVQFLERLVESASAALARLDPDGLVSVRVASRFDRMAGRLRGAARDGVSVERSGNDIALGVSDPPREG